MTHPQRNHEEQGSSFTITQFALGSPLQFEPALGSQDLDDLISNYVPGSALPQQKRAQVVLEFLNSIDALSYSHPVSIRYHVPQVLTPQMMPRHSSMPSLNKPSPSTPTLKVETLNTSKSTPSLKRSREEVAPPNDPSAKRLPGFSIMTRDGIDITDLASRGPKTKEQRDHAALMRKLKACAACKKSKQRCDPSHHRSAQTALSTPTPSSATPSNRSARFSCVSSTGGSRGSISPQSSLGESFSQSPSQSFSDRAIAQAGQSFPPFSTAKPILSPSDFTLPDNLLTESDMSALPMQDFDPELFQLADMELDSWNAGFTAFSPADNHNAWNNHEDIFAPTHVYGLSPETQAGISSEQVRLGSSPHVTSFAEQVLPRQDPQERLARQPGQLLRDTYLDSHGVEFDIDQWLHSTTAQEDYKESQTPLVAAAATGRMSKHDIPQQGLQDKNPALSQYQDYILYPDSPQIEWGLEHHLISRDIGSKRWLPRKEAGSGTLRKRHIDKSSDRQDSQELASEGVRISSSSYHSPIVQSTQLSATAAPYQYLPSPSPSGGSEDAKDANLSDSNLSETEGNTYDTQDSLSQCSTQSNHVQSRRRHSDWARLNVVTPRANASTSRNDGIGGYHSSVRRTLMSPGQPQDLRSVITADVNVGFQSQSEQCNNTLFERPDTQNHTMNFLDDQQAQHTLINRDPHPPLANAPDWDQIWRQRDLRQAGLLGLPVESNNASRLRISNHDMSQMQATVYDVYDAFWTESHQAQQECSLTRYRHIAALDKKMTTIITLCILMTVSLLWTVSLLMTASNPMDGLATKQQSRAIFWASEPGLAHRNSQDDVRPTSFGRDSGPPCQSDFGPGLDRTRSKEDFPDPESNQIFDIQSTPILESSPVAETCLADNIVISEDYSGHRSKHPAPSPTFSSLSGTSALTMAPSTTKFANTWTTQLPARPTIRPKEAYIPVTPQYPRQSSVRSPSSRIFSDMKRSWSRHFNVGHLAIRITSLTIL